MRIVRRFREQSAVLLVIVLLLAINGVVPALVVALSERVLAALSDPQALQAPLLALVGLAVVAPVLQVTRAYLSRRMAWQQVHQLRMEVHEALHAHPDELAAGERLAALTTECDELNVALSALLTGFRAPLSVVSLLVAATWVAPELTLRLALTAPLVLGVAVLGGRLVGHLSRRWRVARASLFAEATDQYNGLLTTLDHHAVAGQVARLEGVSHRDAATRASLEWGKVVPTAVLQSVLVLVLAGLLWTAAGSVAAGDRSMSEVGAFFVAIALLRGPVLRLSDVWSQWSRARAALERVDQLLRREATAPTGEERDLRVDSKGVAGRLSPFVLKVASGRKVAVVGASGSGKSSLLAVLAGRLGESGRDARVVVCRQEPWMFRRTLRENLSLSGPVDEGVATELLTRVGLRDLATRLNDDVGEQGMSLSGGQRQRVALARALLIEDLPLLLDEATSEVEPAVAREIARLLASLERTVVMATHEPWFAELADEVLWMEKGRIRARGSHGALLAEPEYRARWGRGDS